MKRINKISSALAAGAITIGLLLGASAAQAATVQIDGTETNATGILNLDVGGTLYNVEFLFNSSNTLYGSPPIFDFPSLATAASARNAVVDALNTEPAVVTVGREGGANLDFFGIGFDVASASPITLFTRGAVLLNDWGIPDPGIGGVDSSTPAMYASFTVVPVPAAVWLFGSGLLGLVAIARRKKTA